MRFSAIAVVLGMDALFLNRARAASFAIKSDPHSPAAVAGESYSVTLIHVGDSAAAALPI